MTFYHGGREVTIELSTTKLLPADELENLSDSDDRVHREVLVRMRAALDTWIIETGDRGHILEPAEIVAAFEQEMHDWFGTPTWANSLNRQ